MCCKVYKHNGKIKYMTKVAYRLREENKSKMKGSYTTHKWYSITCGQTLTS